VTGRRTVDIAVVGSINADTTYLVPHLPGPGETILGTGRLDAPGGKGANQAAAVAALGAGVDFVAALGHDDAGAMLLHELGERGVGVDHVHQLATSSTGSAVILVADSGENLIVVHPGANQELTPDHVGAFFSETGPEVVMAQCEIPLAAVLAACELASGTVIINPAPMPEPSLELDAIIQQADILVPNRTELASLAGTAVPETQAKVIECAMRLNFEGQLVVTLGGDGALCFPEGPQGPSVAIAAPPVKAVDTSGAGDAFCGALAVAIQRGDALVEAVEFATSFASWSVTQSGAQVPMSAPDSLLAAG